MRGPPMKVLLVSENRCRDNLIPYPLGLAYIAAAARQAGHDVSGLDMMFGDEPLADLATAIDSFEPDCIGLAIRNVDNQDLRKPVFFLPWVREVVDAIRARTTAPIVAGGTGFTLFPLECLEYLDLEMGLTGEGEESFPRLLELLASGRDPAGLPGLALRRTGRGILGPPAARPDFATLPLPDRDTIDVRPYRWSPREQPSYLANLEARRGCHLRCIYCPNPLIEGREMRLRAPGAVADELALLESHFGLPAAMFVDALFNYPLEYTLRLCDEIVARATSIRWSCSLNPSFYDPRLTAAMRRAGCTGVSLGNESGSEDTLAALRKDFSKSDAARMIRQVKEEGLRVVCFLLLGGPGETRETVQESVAFLDELAPDQVTVTVGIRIYPGCELHDIALREGVISPDRNLLEPAFYLAQPVADWLWDYMREQCDARPGWEM